MKINNILFGVSFMAVFGMAAMTYANDASIITDQEQQATQTTNSNQNNSVNSQPQTKSQGSRGSRMICKYETLTGTRLKKIKTCRTAREWRDISRGFQREAKNLTDKGAMASPDGN